MSEKNFNAESAEMPSDAEMDAGVVQAVKRAVLEDRIDFMRRTLGPCKNCGAVSPLQGRASDGQVYCCVHCCFNPLGCRCEHGEFGVAETQQFGPFDDDELEDCYR